MYENERDEFQILVLESKILSLNSLVNKQTRIFEYCWKIFFSFTKYMKNGGNFPHLLHDKLNLLGSSEYYICRCSWKIQKWQNKFYKAKRGHAHLLGSSEENS